MEPTHPTRPTQHPTDDTPSSFRPSRLTAGIVAGGATFAMVLAGLGIASAQTGDGSSTTTPPAASADGDGARGHHRGHLHRHHLRASLDVASTTLGIPVADIRTRLRQGQSLAAIAGDRADELVAALVADAEARLADAVADGRLTQAEADERKATLTERVTALVHRVPQADGGPYPGGRGAARIGVSVAAEVLGLSEADLRNQLREGRSLAAIAGERTDELIAALVARAEERLATAVTDGRLTQAEADARRASLTERITKLVNATPPAPGERRGHRHGPGPEPEAAPASVTA